MIILYQGGRLASWHGLSKEEQGASSQAHVDLMLAVAKQHGLRRIEGFKLLGPQQDWERFWIMEFPTLEGAEAWMEYETRPERRRTHQQTIYLARKWSPAYFAQWVDTINMVSNSG